MARTGVYSSRSRERFGDISIGHLIDCPSLLQTDFAAYSDIVVALLDSSNELSGIARNCWYIDDDHSLTRIGLERESLAMMMLMRVEQLGLKLSIRSSPFSPWRNLMRELLLGSTPRNYRLVRCLMRVEERLRQRFQRALSDPQLAPAIREMLVDALHRAEPGKALRQTATVYSAQLAAGSKSRANIRSDRAGKGHSRHPAVGQHAAASGCGALLQLALSWFGQWTIRPAG